MSTCIGELRCNGDKLEILLYQRTDPLPIIYQSMGLALDIDGHALPWRIMRHSELLLYYSTQHGWQPVCPVCNDAPHGEITCPDCHGEREWRPTHERRVMGGPCGRCRGTGTVECALCDGGLTLQELAEYYEEGKRNGHCPVCDQTGRERCSVCEGEGSHNKPAGVEYDRPGPGLDTHSEYVIVRCDKCGGEGWIAPCSNCGREASTDET